MVQRHNSTWNSNQSDVYDPAVPFHINRTIDVFFSLSLSLSCFSTVFVVCAHSIETQSINSRFCVCVSRAYDNAWTVIVLRFYVLTSFPVHYGLMCSILKKRENETSEQTRHNFIIATVLLPSTTRRRGLMKPLVIEKMLSKALITQPRSLAPKKSSYIKFVNFIRFVGKMLTSPCALRVSVFSRSYKLIQNDFFFACFAVNFSRMAKCFVFTYRRSHHCVDDGGRCTLC